LNLSARTQSNRKFQQAALQEKRIATEHPPRAHHRRPLRIIGVACGTGAPDQRCAEGPLALRVGGLVLRLQQAGLEAAWSAMLHAPAGGDPVAAVSAVAERLARHTRELTARGYLPVVLGGDHSCAIGTWNGVAAALAPRGPLGLIWIDAHMDAHTPATTASGMLHGMPVACLLGHGDPRLTTIAGNARLDPRRVCLVGVRSFETGEAALLGRLGVRVFYMDEIARLGLRAAMEEAIAIAGHGSAGFGVSLDLDAIDPRDAPGVGILVRGGIRACELLLELQRIARHPALAGVEIVEYNPARDRNATTARLVMEILEALLVPRLARVERRRMSGACVRSIRRRRPGARAARPQAVRR